MRRDSAGKIAYRVVRDTSPNGLDTRITTLEGINANTRLTALEDENLASRIATLETQIATLLSHTHSYDDDNGTDIVSKTTSTEQ